MRYDPNITHSFVIKLSKNEALMLANEISRSMQFYDFAAKRAFESGNRSEEFREAATICAKLAIQLKECAAMV